MVHWKMKRDGVEVKLLARPNGNSLEKDGNASVEGCSGLEDLVGNRNHSFDWIIFGPILNSLQNHWP